MGLFVRIKRKKENVDWNNTYIAVPKFYEKADGTLLGAIALTEDTKSVLPKLLQKKYMVDGKAVSEWKLVLVSITKDAVIGEMDYFKALEKIEKYALDIKNDSVLVKRLSLSELETLIS